MKKIVRVRKEVKSERNTRHLEEKNVELSLAIYSLCDQAKIARVHDHFLKIIRKEYFMNCVMNSDISLAHFTLAGDVLRWRSLRTATEFYA